MGYIAAVLNKHRDDASQTMLKLLRAASPRPALSYGIADHRNSEISKTAEFTSHESSILLGSKNIFLELYPPEPLHQGDHSLIFNGILLDTNDSDNLIAANILHEDPVNGIETLIKERNGSYAVVA